MASHVLLIFFSIMKDSASFRSYGGGNGNIYDLGFGLVIIYYRNYQLLLQELEKPWCLILPRY